MAKVTLSMGMTFRNDDEIKQVEALRKELSNTTWTTSSIYLVGLVQVVNMIRKAKKGA